MPTLAEVQATADRLHTRYEFRFAGKPRMTRDLQLLDDLIADSQRLVGQARELGPGAQVLVQQITDRITLYRNERGEISKVQGAAPEAREAALLADRANGVFFRYRLHFAGQDRGTRDTGLLDEMLDDLRAIYAAMSEVEQSWSSDGLRRDMGVVEQNLALYERERGAIVSAYAMGDAEQQASRLARRANNQFAIYAQHFAGQSRLSRRPDLLSRVVQQLVTIQNEMEQLRLEGLRSDSNDRNIGVVVDRISTYREELAQIRNAKEQTALDDLISALGEAANALLAEYDRDYAGKDRGSRDLARLGELWELLGEQERQMAAIERAFSDHRNRFNLGVVRDGMLMMRTEHAEVKKAQGA